MRHSARNLGFKGEPNTVGPATSRVAVSYLAQTTINGNVSIKQHRLAAFWARLSFSKRKGVALKNEKRFKGCGKKGEAVTTKRLIPKLGRVVGRTVSRIFLTHSSNREPFSMATLVELDKRNEKVYLIRSKQEVFTTNSQVAYSAIKIRYWRINGNFIA